MQITVNHPTYGRIEYEESFWTGKKQIYINGAPLEKQSKKTYFFAFNGECKTCTLTGSYLGGAKLTVGSDTIQISRPPKAYETALSVFICVLLIVWGNSIALCSIIPVAGGAIGGAIAGLAAVTNTLLIKQKEAIWQKLLITLGLLVAAFLAAHLILYPLVGILVA
jgi:hypothetical protein